MSDVTCGELFVRLALVISSRVDTMEVDAASTSAAADGAGAGNAIDGAMEELVTRYGELLEALASSPYSRELHDEHVELTRQLGQGFDEAMGMLNDYFPLSTSTCF